MVSASSPRVMRHLVVIRVTPRVPRDYPHVCAMFRDRVQIRHCPFKKKKATIDVKWDRGGSLANAPTLYTIESGKALWCCRHITQIMKGLCPQPLKRGAVLVGYPHFETNESRSMYYLSTASRNHSVTCRSSIPGYMRDNLNALAGWQSEKCDV